MSDRRRLTVLVGVLVAAALVTVFVVRQVLATVFFAVTIAYVLYPIRQFFRRRGAGQRVAAALGTLVALLSAVALFTPLVAALYFRRDALFGYFQQLPETLTLAAGDISYSVNVGARLTEAQDAATRLALGVVGELPALGFKTLLFLFIVYGLLLRPGRLGETLLGPVPREYHDIALDIHRRTRSVLYGIYVLQAAIAVVTFMAALPVFFLLGYQSTFALAVLSGILQFIPIIGPSVLIIAIGFTEVVAGSLDQALLVVVVGLVVIGALPDIIVRPRLASVTTDMPASLYFIGFTGGTLSVGLIGLVAGPVVVAWLAEAVALLSAETGADDTRRTTIDRWTGEGPGSLRGRRPDAEPDGGREPGAGDGCNDKTETRR